MVGRDAACEKGGAGGGADGGDAEEIFETDAVGGDFVDIRRFEFVVSCASKGPGALVVRDEYDNVWMILHDFLLLYIVKEKSIKS